MEQTLQRLTRCTLAMTSISPTSYERVQQATYQTTPNIYTLYTILVSIIITYMFINAMHGTTQTHSIHKNTSQARLSPFFSLPTSHHSMLHCTQIVQSPILHWDQTSSSGPHTHHSNAPLTRALTPHQDIHIVCMASLAQSERWQNTCTQKQEIRKNINSEKSPILQSKCHTHTLGRRPTCSYYSHALQLHRPIHCSWLRWGTSDNIHTSTSFILNDGILIHVLHFYLVISWLT